MANILKRPMFRKGGSASEDTGITSGLRQNYAEGSIDPALALIEQRYKAMQPTQRDSVYNFLGALGATAPQDPTQLQSFGQVLSKAGTGATAMRQQQKQVADSFKNQATIEVIKNLNQEDKDLLIRRAKRYAKVKGIPEDKAIEMFLDSLMQGGDPYLKGQSPQNRILAAKSVYEGEGLSQGEAMRVAKIAILFEDGQLGEAQNTFEGVANDELIVEGNTATFADTVSERNKGSYIAGRSYVNPANGIVYYYDGSVFTQNYPPVEG
jgi:hypothetical protein